MIHQIIIIYISQSSSTMKVLILTINYELKKKQLIITLKAL